MIPLRLEDDCIIVEAGQVGQNQDATRNLTSHLPRPSVGHAYFGVNQGEATGNQHLILNPRSPRLPHPYPTISLTGVFLCPFLAIMKANQSLECPVL